MMFNILNIEYRCVAAALYPPDDLLVTSNDQLRLMKMYNDPIAIDPTELFDMDRDRLGLAKKAMRKYLEPEDVEKMDKLETTRFLLPESMSDKENKK
ncbi:unnamed protein product [Gongylonema pulchrum]|nr:unnamed protein product [Gongylonema pulchrum]